ncbi:MAG TPA: PPOX class F420-dependent oxidoreductase [Ilumatobacteraceae bacterium]|nr:PPOX class F420-dependent oxidoreductase [Ilumatobacteraceae bacterium]
MALSDEKYLALTTFRKSGTPVTTPVWAVPVGDREIGFWTSSTSGKVKRIKHTARVTVQPCNARGKVTEGTTPTEATARVANAAELAEIRTKITAKYGFMTKVTNVLNAIGAFFKRRKQPYGDTGIIVTPN